MGLADKALRGGAHLTAARMVVTLLQAVATVLAAWFLAPDDYGIAAVAMTIILILAELSEMQLGQALIRQKTVDPSAQDTVWTLGLLRALVLAGTVLLLAAPVAEFYGDPRLQDVMFVLALHPLLSGIINPRRFLQEREMIFRQEILITILQKLGGIAATVGLAFTLGNYWALILGALVETGLGLLISFAILPYRPKFGLTGVKEIWSFSIWLTLGQIVNTINWRIEFLIIGKVLGLAQLGIYRLGSTLAQLPTQELMAPVRKVALPGFSAVLNRPDHEADQQAIRRAYQKAQVFATAFALPVGVGFAMVSPTFVAAVLADSWQPTVMIMQYLAAVFALQTLGSLVQPLAMARGETRLLFVRNLQMLVIRLPIILVALYLWAMPGVVAARVLTGLIAIGVNMALVRHLIGLGVIEQLRANIRPVVSVATMALSLWFLQQTLGEETDRVRLLLRLFAEVAFGAVVYVACSVLLWRLMRKPDGPEVELVRLFRGLKARLRAA
jgi:O-antigen/teichoic acid export membrane protein